MRKAMFVITVMAVGSMLISTSFAVEGSLEGGINVSLANGEVLETALNDFKQIEEVLVASSELVTEIDDESLTVYDYGTKTFGEYEISSVLYTFDETDTSSMKRVGGIASHSFIKNNTIILKSIYLRCLSMMETWLG